MKCLVCRRKLTAVSSVINGIGPECAGRAQPALTSAGTTAAQINYLMEFNDEAVQKPLRALFRAATDRRTPQWLRDGLVKRFLEQALLAAAAHIELAEAA
jgi:hypothetical protein